jgi:DNA-binding IclR family transcriptional regulator
VTTSDRLLSVLDLFSLERPDWSVEEAAAALQVATSTTYRYVAALSAKGLLAPLGDGRYVLGPTIIHYDRQIRLTDPLISAAHNEMQRLAEMNFGRTIVFICRLLGGQVMCVDQVSRTDLPMGFGYERGRLMPLFAGAASKIILAHLPYRQLRALHERESAAFAATRLGSTWAEVRAALQSIRAAGHLVTSGEVDVGVRGVSVPLIDHESTVLASLNVAGPATTLDSDLVAQIIEQLKTAAGRIQKEFREFTSRPRRKR